MADGGTMVLQGWPDAAGVRAVRAALTVKGLGFRFEPFPLQWAPRLLPRLPGGRAPVLRDGPRSLVGIRPALDYLEDHHPRPPLRPRDISAAALCHLLEDWAEGALARRIAGLKWLVPANRDAAAAAVSAASSLPRALRRPVAGAAAAAMRAGLSLQGIAVADVPRLEEELRRDLDELDRLLHDRDHLLGRDAGRTLADLVTGAVLDQLFGTTYEDSLRARPSLWRWLAELRPLWAS